MASDIFKIDFDRKMVRPGSKIVMTVRNVDNEAEITLNNHVVYRKSIHHDPPLHDVVDLTHQMTVGKNYIHVKLINWAGDGHNPWHISYLITADGAPIIDVDARSTGSATAGLAYQNDHEVVVSM